MKANEIKEVVNTIDKWIKAQYLDMEITRIKEFSTQIAIDMKGHFIGQRALKELQEHVRILDWYIDGDSEQGLTIDLYIDKEFKEIKQTNKEIPF